MRPLELTATPTGFERRGPGTDAERRAARRLAAALTREGYRVTVEPFWCRPNWALTHAWHVALALVGSLLSVSHHVLGAALLAAALISIVADVVIGLSPGRRLTPERASQNVVVGPDTDRAAAKAATLIVSANYDAGRTGLVYRDALRRPTAWLRRRSGPLALGWLGWLSLAILWVLAVAVIRTTAHVSATLLGVIQLTPSVALVLALALLLDAAGAEYGPAAGDNATGTAVAIALTRALRDAPPRNVTVELLLQGAGEGQEIGLRRHLRAHRGRLRPDNTIVLGVAACGAGDPRWWRTDGRLIPLGYTRRLHELAAAAGGLAEAHRSRGGTPATPARTRNIPAIAVGNLDERGLAPRSHQPADTLAHIDESALDRAVQLGLALVDAIDAALVAQLAANVGAVTPA